MSKKVLEDFAKGIELLPKSVKILADNFNKISEIEIRNYLKQKLLT